MERPQHRWGRSTCLPPACPWRTPWISSSSAGASSWVFTIAAAVGPITLLVIRRTLGSGWLVGMVSGLGVATADAVYGAIAAFGISAASDLLVSLSRPLGFIGGAVLLVIGARTVRDAHVPPVATPATTRGLAAAYASIVGLTLTNPLTILLYGALVVSVGVPASTAGAASLWLGLGVGPPAGSCSWSRRSRSFGPGSRPVCCGGHHHLGGGHRPVWRADAHRRHPG